MLVQNISYISQNIKMYFFLLLGQDKWLSSISLNTDSYSIQIYNSIYEINYA